MLAPSSSTVNTNANVLPGRENDCDDDDNDDDDDDDDDDVYKDYPDMTASKKMS